jgi:hypothetical protein
MDIGFEFMVERKRQRKTQWELSRLSRIPSYKISRFELGQTSLTDDELSRLRRALEEKGESAGA